MLHVPVFELNMFEDQQSLHIDGDVAYRQSSGHKPHFLVCVLLLWAPAAHALMHA